MNNARRIKLPYTPFAVSCTEMTCMQLAQLLNRKFGGKWSVILDKEPGIQPNGFILRVEITGSDKYVTETLDKAAEFLVQMIDTTLAVRVLSREIGWRVTWVDDGEHGIERENIVYGPSKSFVRRTAQPPQQKADGRWKIKEIV